MKLSDSTGKMMRATAPAVPFGLDRNSTGQMTSFKDSHVPAASAADTRQKVE
jgi:hypothetical protein